MSGGPLIGNAILGRRDNDYKVDLRIWLVKAK